MIQWWCGQKTLDNGTPKNGLPAFQTIILDTNSILQYENITHLANGLGGNLSLVKTSYFETASEINGWLNNPINLQCPCDNYLFNGWKPLMIKSLSKSPLTLGYCKYINVASKLDLASCAGQTTSPCEVATSPIPKNIAYWHTRLHRDLEVRYHVALPNVISDVYKQYDQVDMIYDRDNV